MRGLRAERRRGVNEEERRSEQRRRAARRSAKRGEKRGAMRELLAALACSLRSRVRCTRYTGCAPCTRRCARVFEISFSVTRSTNGIALIFTMMSAGSNNRIQFFHLLIMNAVWLTVTTAVAFGSVFTKLSFANPITDNIRRAWIAALGMCLFGMLMVCCQSFLFCFRNTR